MVSGQGFNLCQALLKLKRSASEKLDRLNFMISSYKI